MAEDTSVRNVVWALGLTMAVVAVVAMLFFGVGNDPHRSIPESSRVDVAASAKRAQELAPYRLAVPRTPHGWSAKQARYDEGTDPRWTVSYTAPSGGLVTLTQAGAITPTLVQDTIPGGRAAGTAQVHGISCDVYTSSEHADERALACPGQGWGLVVSGRTDLKELEKIADPAIGSTQG